MTLLIVDCNRLQSTTGSQQSTDGRTFKTISRPFEIRAQRFGTHSAQLFERPGSVLRFSRAARRRRQPQKRSFDSRRWPFDHSRMVVGAARIEQEKLLSEMKLSLNQDQIHFLKVTSTSELSKYFRRPGAPIFVCYNNHFSAPSFIPIEQCTDLFQKYAEKRSITRLYVSPENLSRCRSRASEHPLQYEDGLTTSNLWTWPDWKFSIKILLLCVQSKRTTLYP